MNVDNYRRWFEYEKDSHAKVLDSLNAVPDALRSAEGFQKAVDLMAHIVAARRMWLFRLGVSDNPQELFPRQVDPTALPALIDAMQTAWSGYLANLDEPELTRVFDYQSYEGLRFCNTVEDILTQLFGHSLYHRGQIAMILRSIGAEPAVTDFVFWTREPIEDLGQ
ncbi:MAG: DinB family protein [Pyrinomonadaceae bacterium]